MLKPGLKYEVLKRGNSRKNSYIFILPGFFSFKDGRVGNLEELNSTCPKLFIDFPEVP